MTGNTGSMRYGNSRFVHDASCKLKRGSLIQYSPLAACVCCDIAFECRVRALAHTRGCRLDGYPVSLTLAEDKKAT